MSELYSIHTSLRGQHELRVALARAPKAINRTIRTWLYSVRKAFVGIRSSGPGQYTRWLASQRLRGREGRWSSAAAGAFKGFIRSGSTQDSSTLTMGVPQRNPSDLVRGLEMMANGGGSVTSSKFMPVPVYANLAAIGITGNTHRAFRSMADADRLVSIRTGGQVLWVDKDQVETGADIARATMFVGSHRVRIGAFAFQFESKFRSKWPMYQMRAQRAIERTMRGIDRGYIKDA